MKINKVPDSAFLYRAAGLFSVICYPLRGTNVFKTHNTNTYCKKYLNTNTKYSILYFKYVFCILNTKYIPSLFLELMWPTNNTKIILWPEMQAALDHPYLVDSTRYSNQTELVYILLRMPDYHYEPSVLVLRPFF